jgi:aspartokinase
MSTIAKITVSRENDMLLLAVVMANVKVEERIVNKMLETIKTSTIRASNKSKSGPSINATCLHSKVERHCNHIYKRVELFCG